MVTSNKETYVKSMGLNTSRLDNANPNPHQTNQKPNREEVKNPASMLNSGWAFIYFEVIVGLASVRGGRGRSLGIQRQVFFPVGNKLLLG